MDISGKTKICGVIGNPIQHTLSPTIQNAAFNHLNLDFIFLAFKVRPAELEMAIQGMRSLGIHGLNVTMPHKNKVINYLDEIDSTVESLNSANTIVNKKGRLLGFSTDGIGAVKALQENGVDLSSSKVVLLGAGGAGRAIAFSIADKVKDLIVLNRDIKKVKNLELDLKLKFDKNIHYETLSQDSIQKNLRSSDLLINATNVGMGPNSKLSIVDPKLLKSDLTVMDIVYNPLETKLLSDAKIVGAKTINGLEMLIYQGAASFELWTGRKAPIEIMKLATLKQISNKGAFN
ncbi:MAG: shikimate dehydrogenase [Candidatus Lokiarchaeota archaeon]|nr:shikimate dehydrogenase [Candidatus Lokiarchaeota archaeon]